MGYTHYWKFVGERITKTDVVEVAILLKKCIEKLNGKVLYPNWVENPTPYPCVLRGGNGFGKPIFDTEIHFNGNAETDNACESFDLVAENESDICTMVNWHDGRRILSRERHHFCKTEREPYDTIVCLALLCLKQRLGEDVVINSDGHAQEWEYPKHIFKLVAKENPKLCRIRK